MPAADPAARAGGHPERSAASACSADPGGAVEADAVPGQLDAGAAGRGDRAAAIIPTGRAADPGVLAGGFAEPVRDAQQVFRALCEAMARPGRIAVLGTPAAPPPPLPAAAGAVLAALADADTPVHLGAGVDGPAARAWLAFHTGAPVTDDPAAAAFAIVQGPALRLAAFAAGTAAFPDRSATVVAAVVALDGGPLLTLAGPGIAATATLAPRGLPDDFRAQWAENRARFPLGVDLILVAPDSAAALPRSVRIL